jgi:hypothetical protein
VSDTSTSEGTARQSGAGQRSPSPFELVSAAVNVLRRLPGIATSTVDYVLHRGRVEHDGVVECTDAPWGPDPDRFLPGDASTVLRRSAGRGHLYRRVYRLEIDGATLGPEELVTQLLEDPNRASPTEVAIFQATSSARDVGAEFTVHMPGPWDAPVRVVDRTPTSFAFVTLRGHLEAGEIEFRAAEGDDGRLVFTIEFWARSGDWLYHLLYDALTVTREMQLHMWAHVCLQVAAMAGGTPAGKVQVSTQRWRQDSGG